LTKKLSTHYGSGVKYVYDEIHGFIPLKEVDLRIVSTPTFQRLRRVKQLAQAWYVYPGAVHTRFSHSLGVMRLASIISDKFIDMGLLDEDKALLLRVAALLHDIGHTPYSHALEQYFISKYGLRHEDLTVHIIKEDPYITEALKDYGIEPDEIVTIIRGIHADRALNMILSSDLDVDRLDYLPRDALHTGVAYGLIDLDRIIQTLTLDEMRYLAIPAKAIQAVESFYIARLHMYRAVYYHKTITAYQLLLSTIYALMIENHNVRPYLEPFTTPKGIRNSIKEGTFYLWDDFYIGGILNLVINKELGDKVLNELIKMYLMRKGYKTIYERLIFSNKPNIREFREVIKEIDDFIEREGIESHFIRTFLEVISIRSDKEIKVVKAEGSIVPVSTYEASIIKDMPKYMGIFRVYAHHRVESKVKKVLSSLLNHEIRI